MLAKRRQEAENASFHPVCASLRQTSSKDRNSEGAAVAKHQRSGGDRTRDHETGFVKRKRAQTHTLESSHDSESSAVMNLRQVQFPGRASVESQMISVHRNLRVIAIAITSEPRRAAMRKGQQRIAVVQLRLFT